MTGVVRSLTALFIGMVLMILGNSLIAIVVPLEMDKAGYPNWLSGMIMSVYFGGFAVGAIWGQSLVRKIGFIRTFGFFATIFSATVVLHPLIFHPIAWGLARFLAGLCIAGLFLVVEAWLNDRTPTAIRGAVLGLYATIIYLTQALGTPLVNLFSIGQVTPYLVATLLLSLSLIPIMLTRVPVPDYPDTELMSMRQLAEVSPLAAVGGVVVGVLMGCFLSLAAIFAREVDMSVAQTSLFASAMIAGGVVSMFPMGWLADRIDRRIVLVGLLVGTIAVSFTLALLAPILTAGQLIWLSFGYGVFAAPIYGIVVTQAYDYLEPEQYVAAAAGLLIAYAIGSFVGPTVTGFVMSATSPAALFMVTGVAAVLLALFTLYRMQARSALPSDEQESITIVPQTTAAVFDMDPRSDAADEDEGLPADQMAEVAGGQG